MLKRENAARLRLLAEIVLIIALAEAAIMLALQWLPLSLPPLYAGLLDALTLALVSAPFLVWRLRAHAGTLEAPVDTPIKLRAALVASVAAFVLGNLLTLGVAYQMQQNQQREAKARFDRHADLLRDALLDRFQKTHLALKGLVGMYAVDKGFSRQRFRTYWQTRGFVSDFPGVHGFGFIQYVPRTEVERFLATTRHDKAPHFTLKTAGTAPELYVITLVEPVENNRQAVGLDIGSEAVRRAGAERAIRSGEPTLTGVITLAQDGQRGPGFLLLQPLYRHGLTPATEQERLAQQVGFVYSPIVASEFFARIVPTTLGLSRFEIYRDSDAESRQLVFASDTMAAPNASAPAQARPSAYRATRSVPLFGQTFTLELHSTSTFEAGYDDMDIAIVVTSGMALSGMLAFTIWLLSAGRARAEGRVQQMTTELQRLASIARRTNDAVIITDPQGRITWVNEAFTRITGYTLEEARGYKPGTLLQSEQTDPATIAAIGAHLQRLEPCHVEILNRHKSGRHYWLELEIQPLYDEAGHPSGFMSVERDITQQRQAQRREREYAEQLATALRESEALMSTIHTHAIVSEAGRDGRILKVNDAFCAISGYSREELIGQDHRIVNSGHHDRAFWQGMWRTIASGRPWRGQICNRAKDGRLYWVESIIAPFLDEQGRIQKYISIRFDITRARQAEEELARERQRLKSTLEGTNVGTWEVNVITGESRIDERWAGMLGYTLEELTPVTPEKWQRLIHADDEKIAQSKLVDYLRGLSDIYEVERRLKHKDGYWIWVLSRGIVSTRRPDGRVEWMAGTHMDVTERHLLQEEVQQRNELMTAIIENMPSGLSAFDADLNLMLHNQRFAELLDLPQTLLMNTPVTFESIIRYNAERGEYGQGDVDAIVASIVERAQNPVPHQFERTRPDGRVLEVRGVPLPGGGFVTTYTDITQRRQAERDARRADEMLRQAISTLDEAFVIYDDQDRLLICNQRYRDTYPISAKLMTPGTTFEEIIRYGAEHGEYAAAIGRVDEWVAERLAQHQRADSDLVQELADGRFLRVVERKTSDGYTVGFRIDITDLVRARMAAEEASKSKSQFLANMSHEIRTPMNAILGMLSLLQATELSVRQRDYVNKTEGAAKSLLGLLNDILDFSKVEAGKMTLESAPFRIDHVMRDLSVILSANVGDKRVEVLFDIDPRLPAILVGDSLRLKQVLINLGGNAIKFTQQGMVVVRVEVKELQAGRVTLEFGVRDTGIGIAPENLQRIFEGFSQAEASTTRRFGGTGLGLAISARLVKLMGGTLQVDSELGRGSHFHFQITLPVADDSAAVIEAPLPPDLHQLHVLIIDDNPTAQEVLQAMVEPMGWQAELANSGEAALTMIRNRLEQGRPSYDAVFVDWQMPGMDGWETSLQIRRLLGHDQSPILVMVTAHGREMLAKRPASEQALLNGFLVKPVTPSMLLDAVLEARQAPHERSRPAALPAGQRLRGMRVLVVEDNKVNQQVAQELLEREGALVTLADNGALGVQAIAAADPPWDVVLMDVQMPVMDGYTATRKVRQELKQVDLPIIAMTANAMESDKQDALAAGMNAHVGKPFNLDELVRTMLEHSRFQPATEATASASAPVPLPSTAAASPLPSNLPAGTDELDLASAAERLGGNVNVLKRVLQSFAKDLPRQPQELADLLGTGQGDAARRLLHTLKGTAATVGADRLSAVAAEAENRLRAGHALAGEEAEQMVARVRTAVQAVMTDLAPILQALQPTDASHAGAAAQVDRTRLHRDLEALLALLHNADLGSLELYASLRERHGNALQQALDPLDEAMAALDFEQAARLCEALQQRYTV